MSSRFAYNPGSSSTQILILAVGLEDRYQTAQTAIHDVWLMALIALAIGSIIASIETRKNAGSVSRLYILWIVIVLAIL